MNATTESNPRPADRRASLKITLIYAAFGGLWILFSDRIAAAVVTDAAALTALQTYKGWFYVLVTAVLVYGLVARTERSLRQLLDRLDANNQALNAEVQTRIRQEQHIRRLMDDLAEKNKELESIIYVSSHDLRSPLVNIQGFGGELNKYLTRLRGLIEIPAETAPGDQTRRLLDRDIPEALDFIKASAEKLDLLLQGLLQICRLGYEPVTAETVQAQNLLNSVIHSLMYQIQQNRATVTVEPLPDCQADPLKLMQVFTNLIDNALKYRHPDRPPHVTISAEQTGDTVTYCVADNGLGIDPRHREKIFEMYHQLDPTAHGQGLGLTIVKRILVRMNGRIDLDTEPGRGSRFQITLPAAPDPAGGQ